MPELPEVETVRRGLNLVTLNQTIQGGDVLLDRTLADPSSAVNFLAGLQGTKIVQWQRRGKYLLAELVRDSEAGREDKAGKEDREGAQARSHEPHNNPSIQHPKSNIQNGYEPGAMSLPNPQSPISNPHLAGFLGVHLRMTGQLLWVNSAEPLPKHTRVRLFFASGHELRFVDQRTFGQMWWVPPGMAPEAIMTGLQALGPEPFSEEFSVSYLYEQLHHRHRPIKSALLDQAIVAGIGNIYADEALFLSGIRPEKLCTRLSHNQVKQLHANIVQVLLDSIEAKGTTFSTFRNVEGVNGNYGGRAWVYARDGQPCRTCGTVIARLKLAGRSAHFCPRCQK
ncbi:DNA-formamidopyrimidine glycosylase [Leptodesmis sp.]|uniref:DNA-formamidopyrimidine glycosylase n=1 Tax=Leptodesmis sp. TaxID=3100501 RepID=UPI0040534803